MQEEFTQASRIYLDCQAHISEMYLYRVGNKDMSKDELLKSFDYLLQIMLMYVAFIDSKISDVELQFIDLITANGDCLTDLNSRLGTSYTWESLSSSNIEKETLNKYIEETRCYFEVKVNRLIMFLAMQDAFTKEDEAMYFRKQILKILLIFINFDGNVNNLEPKFIEFIIERLFLEKYNSLKSVFSMINEKE